MTEGEGLKAANGALRQRANAWEFQLAKCTPDVGLRNSQLDPPLLEVLSERLQFARVAVAFRVVLRDAVRVVAGRVERVLRVHAVHTGVRVHGRVHLRV